MGPIFILVTMGWKSWWLSVITFISPVRMNGLKTASNLKGWGCGEKLGDTDTGNKRSVRCLALHY